MAKPELKYLKYTSDYLKHVFAVWAKYFHSNDDLKDFFERISAAHEKDLFLRVGSFYRFLVKEGRYQFESSEWNSGMSYIDDTYKYIAIFSLIEALDSPATHGDFYQWLQRNKNDIEMNFGKTVMAVLNEAYKDYKSEHGATQAAVRFFSRLDPVDQEFIQKRLEIRAKQRSLKQLAQLLYDIRSQFVHRAHIVVNFGKETCVGRQNGQVMINKLSMEDLCMLFERGFLKRFGYEGSTQPGAAPDR